MKPFVVCHMMASLDGRIDCAMTEYLGSKTYYAVLDELACDTMVEGKTTAVMHYAEPGVFTGGDETSVGEPCFFNEKPRNSPCVSVGMDSGTERQLGPVCFL